MSYRQLSDDELLLALRQQRPEAFRQLVEAQKHEVLNICYRFLQNAEDAEDVAQETFVEVHRSISSFRGASSLRTWIYRIAVTRSLSFIRDRSRLKRRGNIGETRGSDDDLAEVPSPVSENPHELLEQKERRRVLAEALDSLSQNQRVAFVLSKCEGMSYQEIAAVLSTTVPSVQSLVHRAKMNLQKKLQKYYRSQSEKSR